MTKFPSGLTRDRFRSRISAWQFRYLRSGFFCVHFMIIHSRLYGISGTSSAGDTISSCRCLIATDTVESPSNGTWPVIISYMVMPAE